MSGAPLAAINTSLQKLRQVVSQRPDIINNKTNLIKQEITEINDLIGQLKERMQLFNGLQREKEELQRELQMTKNNSQEYQDMVARLEDELGKKNQQYNDLQNDRNVLADQIRNANVETQDLEAQISRLDEEMRKMREEAQVIVQERDASLADLKTIEEEIRAILEELEIVNRDTDISYDEILTLLRELKGATNQALNDAGFPGVPPPPSRRFSNDDDDSYDGDSDLSVDNIYTTDPNVLSRTEQDSLQSDMVVPGTSDSEEYRQNPMVPNEGEAQYLSSLGEKVLEQSLAGDLVNPLSNQELRRTPRKLREQQHRDKYATPEMVSAMEATLPEEMDRGDGEKDKRVGGKRMNSKSKKSRKIHMNVLHKKTKHKKMKVKKMSKMGKRKTKHHRKGGFNAAYTCTTSGKTSGNTKKKLKK